MAEKITLYAVLGITESATAEDVEAAWQRQRARLDSGHSVEERRSQLVFVDHAYAVLHDPQKRAQYDRQLRDQQSRSQETPQIEEIKLPAKSRWPLVALSLVAAAAAGWGLRSITQSAQPTAQPEVAHVGARPIAQNPASADEDATPPPPTAAPANFVPTERVPAGNASVIQPPPPPQRQFEVRASGPDAELVKKLVWSVYGIAGNRAFGTGVMVDGEGLITNCHVIAANMPLQGKIWAINAVTHDHAAITDVAYLANQDACLVHAPGLTGTAIDIGTTTWMAAGIKTHNIGYANGRLTSSPGEFLTWITLYGQQFLVTSNFCTHGVSGGPLVDDDGRLVGLTTGSPENNHNICASLTVETVRTLQFQTPIPIAEFPADYISNIERRQW